MAAESGLEAAAVNAPLAYVPAVAAGADDVALATGADASADAQRLLDRWCRALVVRVLPHAPGAPAADRSPVGEFADPRRNSRLTTTPSVAFRERFKVSNQGTGGPGWQNFLGSRPAGDAPASSVRRRTRAGDHALRTFSALRPSCPAVLPRLGRRVGIAQARDRAGSRAHCSIIGFEARACNRLPMRDEHCCSTPTCFRCRPVAAAWLEQMLADFFGVPVAIDVRRRAWYPLSAPRSRNWRHEVRRRS